MNKKWLTTISNVIFTGVSFNLSVTVSKSPVAAFWTYACADKDWWSTVVDSFFCIRVGCDFCDDTEDKNILLLWTEASRLATHNNAWELFISLSFCLNHTSSCWRSLLPLLQYLAECSISRKKLDAVKSYSVY